VIQRRDAGNPVGAGAMMWTGCAAGRPAPRPFAAFASISNVSRSRHSRRPLDNVKSLGYLYIIKYPTEREAHVNHNEAVKGLEALKAGESFSVGVMNAMKRDDGKFSIRQSGLDIGGAPDAELAARSINPASRATTKPTKLIKGQRYEMRDLDHPERATSVGIFDGIRLSDWEDEEPEEMVYFTDGKIGDTPQGIFGFPAAQRREYRAV
jgi:hypothetical protein